MGKEEEVNPVLLGTILAIIIILSLALLAPYLTPRIERLTDRIHSLADQVEDKAEELRRRKK